MKALVYKSTGSWYVVKNEQGEFLNARIKGKFKIDNITSTNPVAVGDIVEVEQEDTEEGAVVINAIGERMLINLTLLSSAIFIFITILIDGYWTIIVITSIVFFSGDILRPAVTSFLSKIAGENQGYIAGMNSAYTSLGIIIGPIIGGILFDINIDFPQLCLSSRLLFQV